MDKQSKENVSPDDWKTTLIASLFSTIDFLKSEITVKNQQISKLVDHCDLIYKSNTTSPVTEKTFFENSPHRRTTEEPVTNSNNISGPKIDAIQNSPNIAIDENKTTFPRKFTSRQEEKVHNKEKKEPLQIEMKKRSTLSRMNVGNNSANSMTLTKERKHHVNFSGSRRPCARLIHPCTSDITNDVDMISNIQVIANRLKKKLS